MRGLFEGIGRSVGGVIGGGASGVVQGLPGGIAGGAAGAGVGATAGALAGAATGGVTGGVTLPLTEPTAIAGGALIGSAGGAAYGFAPGFSQGYGEGYGPGAAVGGGYGQALDQTWLGQKLNAMVKGHEQVEGKGKEADQKKCSGICSKSENSDEYEKSDRKPPFESDPNSTVQGPDNSRTYGDDGYPLIDRDAPHPDESGIGNGDHSHDWGRPEGGGRPTNIDRGPSRLPEAGDLPLPWRGGTN